MLAGERAALSSPFGYCRAFRSRRKAETIATGIDYIRLEPFRVLGLNQHSRAEVLYAKRDFLYVWLSRLPLHPLQHAYVNMYCTTYVRIYIFRSA